jgi:hypothetical protein
VDGADPNAGGDPNVEAAALPNVLVVAALPNGCAEADPKPEGGGLPKAPAAGAAPNGLFCCGGLPKPPAPPPPPNGVLEWPPNMAVDFD